MDSKKQHLEKKTNLHPRNKHGTRYNFNQLIESYPALSKFVRHNEYGDESIDFANPEGVKALNTALLKHFYGIEWWDIPTNYLCPPIPGRADYIHYIADLLGSSNYGKIPTDNKIKCLDIGVGANNVFPMIGSYEYKWSFVGSDIDQIAINSAKKIVENNRNLKNKIEIRHQDNPNYIFNGIIHKGEIFDVTLCNPPFHSSLKDAQSGTKRKIKNLSNKKVKQVTLNFGGTNNELWCKGGEKKFISDMISQSKQHSSSCFWFTTLVSKHENLKYIYNTLKENNAFDVKTIPMSQGNKVSRIVAWTFLNKEQQKKWVVDRW